MQFHRKSYVSKYTSEGITGIIWNVDATSPNLPEVNPIYICVCPTNSSIAAHCDKKKKKNNNKLQSQCFFSPIYFGSTHTIYIYILLYYIFIYTVYIYTQYIYIYTVYIHTHIVIRNPKIFHKVGLMLGRTVWYHVSQTKCHRPQLISYATKQPVQSEANATKA